ncbi:MAG: type II secretion system F family protein [Candidatus Eremiobacterota bacterium]
MFHDALAFMRRFLRAERMLVLFRDEESGEFRVRAAHGLDPGTVWTTAALSLGVLERVQESGQPVLSADAQQDPAFPESSSLLLSGIRSVMCVPLLARDQSVRGMLYADHCMEALVFSRSDLVRVNSYARQLERKLDVLEGVEPAEPVLEPQPAPAVARPEPRSAPVLRAPPRSLPRISMRASVLFLRSLATLMGAGIPIGRALTVLAEQSDEKAATELCRSVRDQVEEAGVPLSTALHGSSFSAFQVQLIRVGEDSGSLVEVLGELADYEERRRAFTLKLLSSLTYPAVLFAFCLVLMIVGPPFLLRGQLAMLTQLGAEPPLLTRMLFAVSDPRVTLALLALPALAGLGLAGWSRTPTGRLQLCRWLLKLPRVGPLYRQLAVARFAGALALQLRVGQGLLGAVEKSAAASGNPLLERDIARTLEALKQGGNLQQGLEACGFFPRMFLVTLGVGEESGSVPATLQWVARMAELELEAALEVVSASLEPLLTMSIGVAAAVVALGTMLPMIKVVQSL